MVLRKTERTILLISRLKNSEKQNRQECKRFLAGFVLVEKKRRKGTHRRIPPPLPKPPAPRPGPAG